MSRGRRAMVGAKLLMSAVPRSITPLTASFRLSITPPGSKSLTNRYLLLAALAEGRSVLRGPLRADDTEVMVAGLRQLGVAIETVELDGGWESIQVIGRGGRLRGGCTLDLHNAGTAVRFLAAACTLADAPVVIDGNARMRQRPIGELVDLLRSIGATIEYVEHEGGLPLRVIPGAARGGEMPVGPTLSSQFISALLMLGPRLAQGLSLRATGELTSPGYITMTLGCMDRMGAKIEASASLDRIDVGPGRYTGVDLMIEPDASSATYFLAAAAVSPGSVCTIEGLGKGSLQPDVRFVDALSDMGAGITFGRDFLTVIGAGDPLHGIDIDCSLLPDAAMTLAVVAAFARGETVLRGLATLRHKETDRLAALQSELIKLGATVEVEDDELLVIEPAPDARRRNDEIIIETYDDHRMAMAFSIAGLVRPGIRIANPGCVAKTYPGYWEQFGRIRGAEVAP